MENGREVVGLLPPIIYNDDGLYQGDLATYHSIIIQKAGNLRLPAHNYAYMADLVYNCYEACLYYRDSLGPRQMRTLLITALFSHFDHTGQTDDEAENITRAISSLGRYIQDEDKHLLGEMCLLIKQAVGRPHTEPVEKLSFIGQILRDADLVRALKPVWIQQMVFGIATESRRDPVEILEKLGYVHSNMKLHTAWAQKEFPQDKIDRKVREIDRMLALFLLPLPVSVG